MRTGTPEEGGEGGGPAPSAGRARGCTGVVGWGGMLEEVAPSQDSVNRMAALEANPINSSS